MLWAGTIYITMAILKIQTTLEISVPSGVKIIRNDEWITLAKKSKDKVQIFTCLNSEVSNTDLNDERNWLFLSLDELKKISSL